jgi:hypothetical protein
MSLHPSLSATASHEEQAVHALTNAPPKKIENHSASAALGYFAYNFIKIHRTPRCTPATEAGVKNRLWEASDLVALLEAEERELQRAARLAMSLPTWTQIHILFKEYDTLRTEIISKYSK